MMAAKANVTDRALRYRAVANMPDCERRCHFCGKPHTSNAQGRSIEVAHINGHEEDTTPENLSWTCRACNVEMANGLRRAGKGRKTRQYNPAHGARSYKEYVAAIEATKGHSSAITLDSAIEILHNTPAKKRSEYARDIWSIRKATYGHSGRAYKAKEAEDRWNPSRNPFALSALSQVPAVSSLKTAAEKGYNRLVKGKSKKGNPRNPAEGAAEMSERFHGRPVLETLMVEEKIEYHTHLAALGELCLLEVNVFGPAGIRKPTKEDLVDLSDFGGALLCSNEDGTQLYVRGGDQGVDLGEFDIDGNHDFEDLGEVYRIWYFTTKEHLGKQGGTADYHHEFGEDDIDMSGIRLIRRPRLRYSTRDKLLSFVGGAYEVLAEGVAN